MEKIFFKENPVARNPNIANGCIGHRRFEVISDKTNPILGTGEESPESTDSKIAQIEEWVSVWGARGIWIGVLVLDMGVRLRARAERPSFRSG